jgi:polar amino acid transport system substrate-binding protein
MSPHRRWAIPVVALVALLTACQSSSGVLLDDVTARGKLVVSTDPNYAPQSFLNENGSYTGFDIDVANLLGSWLGVNVEYQTPSWDAITAGSWSGHWDVSVGSMTITEERKSILAFTIPYYYTPAQMAVTTASGITSMDGLDGKTICVGSSTTYGLWLTGELNLVDPPQAPSDPPSNVTVTELPTDQDCAQAVQAGRTDFEGFLSSATVIQQAIDAGIPIVPIGDPVFYEPLAVAMDLSGPDTATMKAKLDEIIQEMHDNGVLKGYSLHWFGIDLTTVAGT